MASFQKYIALGNLTRDPELKHLSSGGTVANTGLAINERYKNKAGEWVDTPVFVELVFWNKLAEIVTEYLVKGSQVLIEGKLKLDTWEKDGAKHSKISVTVESMQMMGKKQGGDTEARQESKPQARQSAPAAAQEDIPF